MLSENIADVAGLAAAYDAYRLSLNGKPAAAIATSSSAMPRAGAKTREADARRQITTDGHAPDEYRADTVRNLDARYAAFAVWPQQNLFLPPDQRVRVW